MLESINLDIEALSEIEKFLILRLKEIGPIKENFFLIKTSLPRFFAKKIIRILVIKNLISYDKDTDFLRVSDYAKQISIYNHVAFSRLFLKRDMNPLNLLGNTSEQVIEKIDQLYQNSLDLYMLNYVKDALEKIMEILEILEKNSFKDLKNNFHELDVELFILVEKEYKNIENNVLSFYVDFYLVLIFKLIQLIKMSALNSKPLDSFSSKYTEIYKNQANRIELFSRYLQKFNNTSVKLDKKNSDTILLGYMVLYFHRKIGPSVFYQSIKNIEDVFKNNVKKIMDLINPEPFLYVINEYSTLNYQFEIPSKNARGRMEYLQITLIFKKLMEKDMAIFKPTIVDIANQLKNEQNLYLIFYSGEEDREFENARPEELLLLNRVFFDKFRVLNIYL